jgi:hypothetical protein
LFFTEYLIIPLVFALLAEHSFWFSGDRMEKQLSHAIKSFKFQKHINTAILKTGVETAFNNSSDDEDPTWLIQWVIDNKLVGNIILNFLYKN